MPLERLAEGIRHAFGLCGGDIQVRTGSNRLGSGSMDENAVLLQRGGDVLGRPYFGVDAEPDEIGIHFRRMQLEARRVGYSARNHLCILVVIGEAFDVMVERV